MAEGDFLASKTQTLLLDCAEEILDPCNFCVLGRVVTSEDEHAFEPRETLRRVI